MDKNLKEFCKELQILLMKYKASLNVSLEGDTHNLYTNFEIQIDDKEYVINEYGSSLEASDLKEFLGE